MKTQQEIKVMSNVIREQAISLPDVNSFNESNKDEIKHLNNLVTDLNRALSAQPVKIKEVEDWILGKPSDLNDFLM